MIINNSPALGTFSQRDDDGATLDAITQGNSNVVVYVREEKTSAFVRLSPEDQLDFTYWLALQLSPEARLLLVKKLDI